MVEKKPLFIPMKDGKNLLRDMASKAILNTDTDKINDYKLKTKLIQKAKQDTERINKLEQDVSEIKTLLLNLIEKLK